MRQVTFSCKKLSVGFLKGRVAMASRGSRGRRARSATSARDIELMSVQEEEQFRRDLDEVNKSPRFLPID